MPAQVYLALGAGATLLALLLWVVRRRAGWGVFLLAALPGWALVLTARADAPARLGASAATLRTFTGALEAHAAAHGGCIEVVSRCEACDPIVRYARGPASRCAHPGRVLLGADALEAGCIVEGDTLRCGGTR